MVDLIGVCPLLFQHKRHYVQRGGRREKGGKEGGMVDLIGVCPLLFLLFCAAGWKGGKEGEKEGEMGI